MIRFFNYKNTPAFVDVFLVGVCGLSRLRFTPVGIPPKRRERRRENQLWFSLNKSL